MSFTRSRIALAACIVVVTGACAADPAATGPSFSSDGAIARDAAHTDMQAERTALLAADRAYAAASAGTNVIEGISAMVAPDVIFVLGPNHVVGAAAVRAALSANPANFGIVQTWTPIRVDVSADGAYGYTYGYIELHRPGGVVLPGKYLTYWQKQPDGSWKALAYKRGGRPAGDVSLTPPPGFESPDYTHYRHFDHVSVVAELARVQAIDQAFSDYAAAIGTPEAFLQFVADDGAAFGASPSIAFGPDAVAASHADEPAGSLIWSPQLGSVAATGDLAFTTGGFQSRVQQPDGTWTVVGAGKYMTIWKRDRTGEWRVVIDG